VEPERTISNNSALVFLRLKIFIQPLADIVGTDSHLVLQGRSFADQVQPLGQLFQESGLPLHPDRAVPSQSETAIV